MAVSAQSRQVVNTQRGVWTKEFVHGRRFFFSKSTLKLKLEGGQRQQQKDTYIQYCICPQQQTVSLFWYTFYGE
jgi:hypothetical protein